MGQGDPRRRHQGDGVAQRSLGLGQERRHVAARDPLLPADACGKHPHLRELLIELAAEVALNRGRAAGDSVGVRAPISNRAGDMGAHSYNPSAK